MSETRLPREAWEWIPQDRERIGRPRSIQIDEIRKGVREKRLEAVKQEDKDKWRKKMTL